MKNLFKILGFFLMLSLLIPSCKDDENLEPLPYKGDSTVSLLFNAKFNGTSLDFNKYDYLTEAKEEIGFTKMKIIFSNFLFQLEDGRWDTLENAYGYISMVEDNRMFAIEGLPFGNYKTMKFNVGLDSAANFGDPSQWAPGHALNPNVNGMHWGWAGGYQFNSIEGTYVDSGAEKVFSFHTATPRYRRTYEFANLNLVHDGDEVINMDLNADQYFKEPYEFSMKVDGDLTHSFDSIDPIMDKIFANCANLFEFKSIDE